MFSPPPPNSPPCVAQFHLLATVPFDDVLALQHRLVYEASGGRSATATVIVCEHEPLVTIGRHGSRSQLRADDDALARRGLAVRWVNRGGGVIVHATGQLAVYPIVPLARFGLSVGGYMERLQTALAGTAADCGLPTVERSGRRGLWCRGGRTAAVGAAVRGGVAYFGFYLNVDVPLSLLRSAGCEPSDDSAAFDEPPAVPNEPTSLAAELRRPQRMQAIRRSVITRLSTALGCERYHVVTGHPRLPRSVVKQSTAHVE